MNPAVGGPPPGARWTLTVDPGVRLADGDVVLEALDRLGRDLGVEVRHGHGAAGPRRPLGVAGGTGGRTRGYSRAQCRPPTTRFASTFSALRAPRRRCAPPRASVLRARSLISRPAYIDGRAGPPAGPDFRRTLYPATVLVCANVRGGDFAGKRCPVIVACAFLEKTLARPVVINTSVRGV